LLKQKYCLFFLAAAICCHWSFASGQKTDSIPIIKRLVTTNIPPDTKLRFLNKLCAQYWTIDPDSALMYGWQGKMLLSKNVSKANIGRHHFVLGMAWENKGNFDSALWYLNRGMEISAGAGDQKYQYRAIEQIGSLYRIMGRYDTAVALMNNALDYFKTTGNNYQVMSTLFNIGSVYLEQNRFNKALEYYQASAAFDTILRDTSAMAIHLLGIGNIYLNLGNLFKLYNPEKSRKYFSLSQQNYRRCATLFLKSDHQTGFCFTSMSLLSSFIGAAMHEQADSLLKTDSACLSFPDPRISASLRISQAQLLDLRGKRSQALAVLREVAGAKGEMMILPEFHNAMLLMAGLLRAGGSRDSAWKVAETSLGWARKNSIYPIAYKALSMMANWSEADGNTAGALAATQEAGCYKDSLFIEIGKEVFDETELNFANQSLQAEVVKLETDQKIQKSRNLAIKLAGTIALLILALIIMWLVYRHRMTNRLRLEAEQKMLLSEQEKELVQSSVENLHLAMQIAEQDLIYHTLQNADLTQVNQSIREKMGEFQFRFQKKKDQDQFGHVLKNMHRDAQKDPLGDFEVMFSRMHKGFFEKLLAAGPELSKAELQICALLRLNLSSKDIARLVNLTVATVDVTRSHIRKKLSLDQNQSLTSYLIMLG
jgi:tetratricopeptide (TPR) repeat protein/DNA-binding CsgD family transcriptional regulator